MPWHEQEVRFEEQWEAHVDREVGQNWRVQGLADQNEALRTHLSGSGC